MNHDFAPGKPGIFIALDDLTFSEAMILVDKLSGTTLTAGRVGFKANDLLHDPGMMQLARAIHQARCPLFADAKLHDIPNTVFNTTRRIVRELQPRYLTVHASGGSEMVKAAVMGAHTEANFLDLTPTCILAVTVLTSLDDDNVADIYQNTAGATDQVRVLMNQAKVAGGFVSSAKELMILPEGLDHKKAVRVVPGIRPEWYQRENPPKDDQKRVATPAEAIRDGATHLVIGRPIVRASNPLEALIKTLMEIDNVQ